MLQVSGLKCNYNKIIQALLGVSITVKEGEIVSLLGLNGAGKTTTLRCIMGEVGFFSGEVVGGEITYRGESIVHLLPFEITRLGISLIPENRELFIDMTVDENLMMGAYTIPSRKTIKENYQRVFAYFPILEDLRHRLAGYLSGGEQQMLSFGRALMSNPKLLLLDEPSIGLAPLIVSHIFEIIERISRENRVSILLVEQNAHIAVGISETCFVLENGRLVLSGESLQLRKDPRVRRIYLGAY